MSPDHLSRRSVLGGALGLSALALAGCGSTGEAPGAESSARPTSGPWSFTDDLGQELRTERTPTRIAAYGDAAAALWHFGITPVAVFHYSDPAQDPTFDGLDLSRTEVIGTAYGEIDLEKLVGAAPDLVVTTTYQDDTPDTLYGFKDKTQIAKVRALAPIAGVLQKGSALDVIKANEKLVASLGIDVEGGHVAADRAAFEKASTALTAAARSGLSVLPVYGEDANLYYAKAPDDPALRYYQDLGVQFTPVKGEDYYWEIVSWERADTYDADIVLYSERDSYTPAQLEAEPTFARLAAVKAEQLHPWEFTSMDYVSQAAYMRDLAGWLGSDRKVT